MRPVAVRALTLPIPGFAPASRAAQARRTPLLHRGIDIRRSAKHLDASNHVNLARKGATPAHASNLAAH